MAVLFTQWYDLAQGKEEEYGQFITDLWLPETTGIGLIPVGAYYVEVGSGPRIVGVHRADTTESLYAVIAGKQFKKMTIQLKSLVSNYRSSILEPTGSAKHREYVIQKGVWKFNQYYDLRPGRKEMYADFVINEYIPALERLGYVEVTGGWNVVLGGPSEIVGELTFRDPIDIGRMLNSPDFRRANLRLQDEFVINYQNRILRCTERFKEPKWFRL